MNGLWIALCMTVLGIGGPWLGWHARLIVLEYREDVVKWRQKMADDMLRMAQAVREQTAEMLAADRDAEPQPVQVVEILAPSRPAVDLLPLGPPTLDEVPTFASIPVPLPPRDDLARFDFGTPRWLAKTGAFPTVDPDRVGRERFAAPAAGELLVTVDVGGEVRGELLEVGA